MDLKVELATNGELKKKPTDPLNLPFGSVFTDHMLIMEYSGGEWQQLRIEPYHSLELDPSAMVLHYGQGIFEGMKAYRSDNQIYLFRPDMNLKRLNASAERMVIPTVDAERVLEAIRELLRIEREWIPEEKGTSLYMRPTIIATEPKLGVRPAHEYFFYVILSPAGPYFKEGFNPISVMVSEKYVRAVRGGVGHAKTMGNYAASLRANKESSKAGFSQTLYLDALERKNIEECGTMNVFVHFEDELATPPLNGTILPGITRDSVIQLAREWGFEVSERPIPIQEIVEGIETGHVLEVFGTGTAAIIAPIGVIGYAGEKYKIGDGDVGDLSRRLFDEITGLQHGLVEDRHGWVEKIT
ncbi:branched-chain amino acid aminotransferase [Candidatus Thorarchaeota archaeon]|nr:MAG: branched-chain amino acid aminotransferase [Candidatus Thorarchaeota archaeon]